MTNKKGTKKKSSGLLSKPEKITVKALKEDLLSFIYSDFLLRVIVSFMISSFFTVYKDLAKLSTKSDFKHAIIHPNFAIFAVVLIVISIVFQIEKKYDIKIFDFIYEKRWYIAIAALIVAVALNINNSSIHQWVNYLGNTDNGVSLGVARGIRSDEWARGTIIYKALDYENYPFFSSILRATPTETVLTTGKVAWDISALYRPATWGFLILGFSRGLSFLWCFKMIFIFMTSFDLFMVLTKKRFFSISFALAMLWAPVMQWWFATPITDLILFGFGAILAFRKYLLADKALNKIAYVIIVIICGGAFVLTCYPAWIVPCAYIVLGLFIWVVIENRKSAHMSLKRDVPIIFGALLFFGASMGYIFWRSIPEMKLMMNTAYPGTTRPADPVSFNLLFSSFFNIYSTVTENLVKAGLFLNGSNMSEMSAAIMLFPLGILLSIVAMIKKKKADSFSIILKVISVFFGVFSFLNMPLMLRKITLMNFTMPKRLFPILALIQLIILFRAVSLLDFEIKWYYALVISIVFAFVFTHLAYKAIDTPVEDFKVVTVVLITAICYFALRAGKGNWYLSVFSIIMIGVSMAGGGMVNPVQKGTAEIDNSGVVDQIHQIV